MTHMRIAIIVAMDKEFIRIKELLEQVEETAIGGRSYTSGRLGNNELMLHQCGIGKVNAAIGVTELIRLFNPDLVVSTGCAGGASDMLEVTDVVVSRQLAYHDVYCGCALGETVYGQVQGMPARYTTPREIVEKALACGERIHEGLIVTGDWFVDDQEKMRSIIRLFPEAMAVDMESAAIAQTCHVFGIPSVSFRVISDIPLKDTKASQYHDFWAHVADTSFATTRRFLEQL